MASRSSSPSGDLLLDLVRAGDAKAGDHLAQLLARGDVGDSNFAELLQVEHSQSLGEELAVDDALAEAGNDAEADPTRELVERGTDALQIMRFDVLETVPQYDPIDTLAGHLGALGAAVPDQFGVEARLGDFVILGMYLADEVKVDEAIVHRSYQCIGLEDCRTRDRVVAAGRIDDDHVSFLGEPADGGA